MFHRDQTEQFGAGNMPNLHGIVVLTASLPIFLLMLAVRPPTRSSRDGSNATESIPTCPSPPPLQRSTLTSIR